MEPDALDGLEIVRIETTDVAARWSDAFVQLYKRVFAAPPYEEAFTDDEAAAVWRWLTHAPHHLTFLAVLPDGEVVGFGSAVPVTAAPDVSRALSGLLPTRHTMYMAELGVLPHLRGSGLAKKLIRARIQGIDRERYTHVVLRIPEGWDEAIEMYHSMDFHEMGVSMPVRRRRISGETFEEERWFMSRVLSQVPLTEE